MEGKEKEYRKTPRPGIVTLCSCRVGWISHRMAKEESLKNEKSWSAKNVITMLLPPFTIVIFLSFRTLLKRTVAHVTAFSKISYHLAALVPKKKPIYYG